MVGFLNSASAQGYASMAAAFKQGLKEAGYAEGQNVTIEYRWADNQYERLPALAGDLVNRRVNVIFANSPSIPAALAATKTIPIIFNSGDDPVRLGFVASLNRPGGNATGVAIFSGELAAKRLELLRELIPSSKTIAVLINVDFGPSARFRTDVEAAARASLAAKRWRLPRLGDPPPACPPADCSVGAGSAGHLSSPPGFLLLLCFNRRRRNLQPKNTNLRNLRSLRSLCSLRNLCSLCSLWRSLCSPYSRTLGSHGRAVCRDGVFRRLPYRRDRKSLGSRPRFLLLQV